MASSSTQIANLALGHLNQATEIQELDTDNSAAARACRRFFETARKLVLRDFPWPKATKITALALVEEDPNDEWAYSYRYPTDCLQARRIRSGLRNDNRQSRIPYRIVYDAAGALIYTDQEDAELEYTVNVTTFTRLDEDFVIALSYRLAAYIAPMITGGDPNKLGDRALRNYKMELAQARANALNEEQAEEEPYSEFERAR